jgi:hypothetical protein
VVVACPEGVVCAATLQAAADQTDIALGVLVREDDAQLVDLAIQSGFEMTGDVSGTPWMDPEDRPQRPRWSAFSSPCASSSGDSVWPACYWPEATTDGRAT